MRPYWVTEERRRLGQHKARSNSGQRAKGQMDETRGPRGLRVLRRQHPQRNQDRPVHDITPRWMQMALQARTQAHAMHTAPPTPALTQSWPPHILSCKKQKLSQ